MIMCHPLALKIDPIRNLPLFVVLILNFGARLLGPNRDHFQMLLQERSRGDSPSRSETPEFGTGVFDLRRLSSN